MSYRVLIRSILTCALFLVDLPSSVKCSKMTEHRKVDNNRLTHFLHFVCLFCCCCCYIQVRTNSMCSVRYNFRYFKVRNFFNQAFSKYEDVFSFFVILFRNTINPKAESATVLFQLIKALLDFFVLLCQCFYLAEGVSCYLSGNFWKSDLISLLKFASVLLLTSNEFFNSKFSIQSFNLKLNSQIQSFLIRNFSEHLFLQCTSGGCFWKYSFTS